MQVSRIGSFNQFSVNQNQKTSANKNNPNFGLKLRSYERVKGEVITPQNRTKIKRVISQIAAGLYDRFESIYRKTRNTYYPKCWNFPKSWNRDTLTTTFFRKKDGSIGAEVKCKGVSKWGHGVSQNPDPVAAVKESLNAALDEYASGRIGENMLTEMLV